MDQRYQQLSTVSGVYYDVPWCPGSPLLVDSLSTGIGDAAGWKSRIQGPWVSFLGPEPMVAAGWKVHVSALPQDAGEVARICWRACQEYAVSFKMLRSRGLVLASQQKYAGLTSSGKVIVCYPDPDRLQPLCERLAAELAGRPAPPVFGELAVGDAPVYLRYGAFTEHWTAGETGDWLPAVRIGEALVPDRRGVSDPRPDEPAYVRRLRQPTATTADSGRLDVTDATLIHRSNAGGVYRARLPDGRWALLKEARQHCGLDPHGVDAQTRLRHEFRALQRMSGSGATPEPIAYTTVGSSDFLIMEWIDGSPLGATMARRHPAIRPDASPDDTPGYLDWVDRTMQSAESALGTMQERGVVHGDLQPANLIDAGDRTVIIDLETSVIDGEAACHGIATPGFSTGDRDASGDREALERIRSTLINPVTPLLARRPDLASELHRAGLDDLGLAGADGHESGPSDDPGLTNSLLAGMAASATPERQDRLFPGDVEQLSSPRGGLGLLYGAAGVLLALDRCGRSIDDAWLDWLIDHSLRSGPFPRGLGSGVDGVAWALAELGAAEPATTLIDGLLGSEPAVAPWWRCGRSGMALVQVRCGVRLGREELLQAAASGGRQLIALTRSTAEASGTSTELPGYRPGLLDGWAGVAATLITLAEFAGSGALALDVDECYDAAGSALGLDLDHCRQVGPALLAVHRGRLLPYLGCGSAGIGLVALELLRHDVGDPNRLAAIIESVRATCRSRQMIFAGLLTGRAGLSCTLDYLSDGSDPALAVHRRRLSWYAIEAATGQGTGSEPEPYPTAGMMPRVMLGDHNLRASLDLATGSAGALLALAPDAGRLMLSTLALADLQRHGDCHQVQMTSVNATA